MGGNNYGTGKKLSSMQKIHLKMCDVIKIDFRDNITWN